MMTGKIKFAAVVVVAVVVGVGIGVAWAQQDAPANAPADVVVLDTFGTWRMHGQLAPPVLTSGETVSLKYIWLNYETPGPAPDWMKPDFDDHFWSRGGVGRVVKSRLLSKACLRGKFIVINPTDVKKLRLSVNYRGGLIVYLNGKELLREHIAKDKSVAEGVPGEERNLTDYAIPSKLLKKGTNVIGLKIVRTAYAQKSDKGAYGTIACEILRIRLTSTGASGLVPNAVRPEGFQIWNADVLAGDFDLDFGDPVEPLRPVKITGARNGSFTGKVVVGSTEPIRNLKVTPGALRRKGGTIPASNVHIRYGILWGQQNMRGGRKQLLSPYPTFVNHLGALAEQPLDEFSVMKAGQRMKDTDYWWCRRPSKAPGHPKSVSGAVVPIWITVKVPADVKAGTYTGKVRIKVEGQKAVTVPVELDVADYILPDTQDYRTWVDMVQCPDTLAVEYSVPLWSDEHFKMIAQSFKLIGQTGSRTVYVPLIAHTNLGNEESMVRWVKKGDGFEHDFSIMERYLDVAEKNMGGKPKLVIFVVWDHYMMSANTLADPKKMKKWDARLFRKAQMAQSVLKAKGSIGHGPLVTVRDPKTDKVENLFLPTHYEPEVSKPLWKPLFDKLRSRLKKRGLEEKMMLGIMSDALVSKEQLQFFKEVSGDVPWVIQSHEGWLRRGNPPVHGVSRVGYQTVVWPVSLSDDGADRGKRNKGKIKSLCGWKRKNLVARFSRTDCDKYTGTAWRHFVEPNITGDHRGKGRLGADYWKVIKNKKGIRKGRSHERYPESNWRNLVIRTSLLAPGPTGPVATNGLDAFREGVQECEARITIEEALYDETLKVKLGPDLARRCEDYLHARHMIMWLSRGRGAYNHYWFLSSGWQTRTAKLFTLAGEVTRKLEQKGR